MKQYLRMAMIAAGIFSMVRTSHAGPTTAPAKGVIHLGRVKVDRAAGTASFPARVVKPGYMLEFLLCRTGTKDYESILATDAQPHDIHAALLLLGLSPGLPAETVGETFLPPRGAKVAIELRWTDKAGREHTASAGDWLASSGKDGKNEKSSKPSRWVFVGSDLLPGGGYAADENGGIIAVANVADAVLDVPMASTKALRERRFVPNKQTVPPSGTEVEILLRPDKNAARAPYARALLEIGPRGELAVDGRPVTLETLSAWAEAFSGRHKYGRVVIRSAAETPAGLAPLAKMELKLGGVYDFEFCVAPAVMPLLPRTDEQLQAMMKIWRERFDHPEDQLEDPAILAEQTVKQIERRRAELKELDALWSRYAQALDALRGETPAPPRK